MNSFPSFDRETPRVLVLGAEYASRAEGGGLATATRGLCEALQQRGLDVTYFGPQRAAIEGAESGGVRLASAEEAAEGELSLPRLIGGAPSSAAVLSAYGAHGESTGDIERALGDYARATLRFVSKGPGFDVVHAHDWAAFPAGEALKRVFGLPLLCHFHSTEFERRGRTPWESLVAIEQRALDRADRVICVSRASEARLKERYAVRGDRLRVLHGALPDGSLEERSEFTARAEPRALFAARFDEQKDPFTFVRAAALAHKKRPDARFLMVGDGPLRKPAIELAASEGVSRALRFPGFLHGGELSAVYSGAAAYVLPSRVEPFGLAPLEALSRGAPIVLTEGAGVLEVLESNEVEQFQPGDHERLSQILVDHFEEPARAAKRSAAQGTRLDACRWSARALQLEKLYTELIAEPYRRSRAT